MVRYWYSALASVAILALAGCTQETPLQSDPAAEDHKGDFVAQSLAIGMGTVAARSAVLQAMRASPFGEHKLVLQDFLKSHAGEELVEAMRVAGVPVEKFLNAARDLPRLQFYAPNRSQRLTWHAEKPVLVAPNLGKGAPAAAFESSGNTVTLSLTANSYPSTALFVLQFVEPMAKRIVSQGKRAGLTIQDADDLDPGGSVTVHRADGTTFTYQMADLPAPGLDNLCEQGFECGGEPGGGGGSTAGLYLIALDNNGVCDNVCVFETLEFRFSSSPSGGGLYITAELTGIGSEDSWYGSFKVSPYRPISGQYVAVHTEEVDSFSGADHFFCQWPLICNGGGSLGAGNPRNGPGGALQQYSYYLCEDTITGCNHSPYDLAVVFQDKP